MPVASGSRKVVGMHPKCVECGGLLPEHRLKWRANTCSARCGQAHQHRLQNGTTRRRAKPKSKPPRNPPILGLTLMEAAERIGVSHSMAYIYCVEHGIGRRYDDRRWWLTLTELRTLTEHVAT